MAVSRLKATPGRASGRLASLSERLAFLSGPRGAWILVAALTVAAFLLRLPHIDESLLLDEHYAYAESNVGGFWDVIEHVRDGGENSPPLYFVLAWAAMKLGDPTVLIRLPSLILSTATVPVVYLLGVRTVGPRAGLIAAALLALSPFAIYYSSEARPYATLMFFVACSTLVLLVALERHERRWWVLYALTACAVLYSHYFGAFALIAQGGWAFWTHRERFRELVLAHIGIALGFVPWLLIWVDQKGNSISQLATYWPLGAEQVGRELLRLFPGHPMLMPGTLPGLAAVILVGVAVAAALIAAAARGVPKPSSRMVLVVLLAVTPAVGFVAYSELGPNIVIARYMSPALPAITLLVGAALASAPRPVALAASAVVIVCVAIGAISSLEPEHRRPAWREAAHYIDRNARSHDLVVTGDCGARVTKSCVAWARNPSLEVSFERPHRTSLLAGRVFADPPQQSRLFVAGVADGYFRAPRPGVAHSLCLVRDKEFGGPVAIVVNTYAPTEPSTGALASRDGHEYIALPSGDIPVVRGAAKGDMTLEPAGPGATTGQAWAVDRSRKPADCVIAFMDGRLVTSALATVARPDIEKIYGPQSVMSGFSLNLPEARPGRAPLPSGLRVFAVSDGVAAEIGHWHAQA